MRDGVERKREREPGGLIPVLSATFHPFVDNLSRSYTQTSSVINRDKRRWVYLSFSFFFSYFRFSTNGNVTNDIRVM